LFKFDFLKIIRIIQNILKKNRKEKPFQLLLRNISKIFLHFLLIQESLQFRIESEHQEPKLNYLNLIVKEKKRVKSKK